MANISRIRIRHGPMHWSGWKRFPSGIWLAVAFLQIHAGADGEELRTAAAVRRLTVEEAQQGAPVRLRGIVTFFDEALYSRFIQDETAGIYLRESSAIPPLEPGQVVEVEGTTSPGEYAPVVVPTKVQVVGEAPLPAPKPATYEQLASGNEDSQFVEIAGIVRWAQLEPSQHHLIEIATGGGRLMVFAHHLPPKHISQLLDSTVRVRGVCSTLFNHRRQLFAIRLMVPRPEDLVIEMPAPKDPFDVTTRPISSLLQFTPRESYGHRVKVKGTVILIEPGKLIFLQDDEQGVEVQTRESAPLQLGDQVEALGFPGRGDYTPVLQDAVFRKVAQAMTISPALVTPDEALKGTYDCRLIRMTARLLDRTQYGQERYLILQAEDFIFHAYLSQTAGQDAFAHLENGSRISVTGVCKIEPGEWYAGEGWRAKSLRIQMRSADDVALIQAPPWWTFEKVLLMAGAMGCVALAAFGWVVVLRRQVTERSQELVVQIQERQRAERRREIEQERARVAHDLHDDLGAGLTEVNMLSSLVKNSATSAEERQRYLNELTQTARRMVTSLDEIVWAVNPRNDTIASLASYFGSYAQRLLDLASISCGLDVAEDLPDYPLDPRFRQELFFAFKEALTNVVRHSGATQVWLRIRVRNERLTVVLSDNGRGVEAGTTQAGADGLTNMQERLAALDGRCEISSEPQKGTTVKFEAPLPKRLL